MLEIIQNTPDIPEFFAQRAARRNQLNHKIAALKKELEMEAENNCNNIIFSIPLSETFITFTRHHTDANPQTIHALETIEIIQAETILNSPDKYEYGEDIIIRFKFNIESFNVLIRLNALEWHNGLGTIGSRKTQPPLKICFREIRNYFAIQETINRIKTLMDYAKLTR